MFENLLGFLSISKNYNSFMKIILSIFVFIFSYTNLCATAQHPDKIIYNDKEYDLQTNPLELFFEKYPDKFPKGVITSSALWRGYVATFEITDNHLMLKDIQIRTFNEKEGLGWKSVIDEVFPEVSERKIDWFNGLLTLAYGEVINYVHMGYGSTYENYILIEIEKGKFIKAKEFDYKEYEEFKNKQFEVFKKTKKYLERKKELEKDKLENEEVDRFLRSYIIEYTQKIL